MGGSINGGTPIAGWFIRENPTKMDYDWGYPYFRKPPLISIFSSGATLATEPWIIYHVVPPSDWPHNFDGILA